MFFMDRTLQLTEIFTSVHRDHMTIKDALAHAGLAKQTFYDIPEEDRESVEGAVIARLSAALEEAQQYDKRIEAEREITLTVLKRMPDYIDALDELAKTARREDVRARAIEQLVDIARNGVFLPRLPEPKGKDDDTPKLPALNEVPLYLPPIPPGSAVIFAVPNRPAPHQAEDVVDGEMVLR